MAERGFSWIGTRGSAAPRGAYDTPESAVVLKAEADQQLQALRERAERAEAERDQLQNDLTAAKDCDASIRSLIAAPAGVYTFTAVLDELNHLAGEKSKAEAEVAALRERVKDIVDVPLKDGEHAAMALQQMAREALRRGH